MIGNGLEPKLSSDLLGVNVLHSVADIIESS